MHINILILTILFNITSWSSVRIKTKLGEFKDFTPQNMRIVMKHVEYITILYN